MQREITDAFLRSAKPPATGRTEVWDTRVEGLMVRLTPTGAVSWSIRGRTAAGKRTRVGLGTWPAVGVSEARKRALVALAALQGGADPVQAKRDEKAARAARAAAPTVAQRLMAWQRAKAADWSQRYRDEIARQVDKDIVPLLGGRVLADTTRADWTGLVAAKRKAAPAMASSLFRTVSSFLGHAEAHGWITEPLLPRKGLASIAPPVEARARVLTDDELRRVWAGTEKLGAKPRAFVRLLALTAARVAEVGGITVGEVDLDAGLWRLPAGRAKNGRALVLPLGPLALRELRAVWPAEGDRDPERPILGRTRIAGLSGSGKIKANLDEASGVTNWRFHDLRRTARTGMARLGVVREHAEAALNHATGRSGLVGIYDRHSYESEAIAALHKWQTHLQGLVDPAPGAAVVPIRRVG